MTMHKEEWEKIWQSRIDVIGNCSLARVIHSSYYYILSSTPISTNYDDDGWPFFGLSPASLANDDSQVKKTGSFKPGGRGVHQWWMKGRRACPPKPTIS
jgi:hypothetical protein